MVWWAWILVAAMVILLLGLGVTLIVLAVKTKVGGIFKKFLLLTGASTVGFLIFTLLHNIISGLLNTEEPVFFFMAAIVCPIGFLVGGVGSIVLARRQPKNRTSPS